MQDLPLSSDQAAGTAAGGHGQLLLLD